MKVLLHFFLFLNALQVLTSLLGTSMSTLDYFMNTHSYTQLHVISSAYLAEISYGNEYNAGKRLKTNFVGKNYLKAPSVCKQPALPNKRISSPMLEGQFACSDRSCKCEHGYVNHTQFENVSILILRVCY